MSFWTIRLHASEKFLLIENTVFDIKNPWNWVNILKSTF